LPPDVDPISVKLLTLARDLQRRKARERHQLFVAEGVRTVESLLASALPVRGLLVTPDARRAPRVAALCDVAETGQVPVHEISDADLQSAADTENPQGVLAIAAIPETTLRVPAAGVSRFLVLDALQDPGNVGTVVRTAAALGVTATICLPGTVDVWNAKVVRGAMGALFSHPVITMDWDRCSSALRDAGVTCWAGDLGGVPLDALDRGTLPERLALVVSNEGAGLSPHLEGSVAKRVAIPMAPGTESLNVAVATGILLHALRPVHASAPAGGATAV
jgi:RNA methyltransferase, TrmH family